MSPGDTTQHLFSYNLLVFSRLFSILACMQLLAFSCNNIGPFFNRTTTVHFLDGKYLIKAPIWSGKSFLFFDGPLFGLYKYSSRPMLSVKAESGWIKILFAHNDKILLCVRDIARTKSWNDTVKSSIFLIEDEISAVQTILSGEAEKAIINQSSADTSNKIILRDIDLLETLVKKTHTEAIVSKNETDVQATLESFLPPKEVFLSTTMLLQDSTNVFELQPTERISLFKEIFGLLSIDSATDRINDERRNATATLKAKWDTNTVDKRLQEYLYNLIAFWKTLISLERSPTNKKTDILKNLIEEIELVYEKISINGFSLGDERTAIINEVTTEENARRDQLQKDLGTIEQQQTLLDRGATEIRSLQTTIAQTNREIIDIEHTLKNTWLEILEKHNARKKQLQSDIDALRNWLPQERFAENKQLEGNLTALRNKLQEDIQQGKMVVEQQNFAEKTLSQLEQKKQEEEETILHQEKILAQLQTYYQNKKIYYCEKTGAECPFIELINTGFFATLQKNILQTQTTLDSYKKKFDTINTRWSILAQQEKLDAIAKEIKSLRELATIRFIKEIDATKKQFDAYQEQLQTLQREDSTFELQAQERQNNIIKKAQLEEKLSLLEKTLLQANEKQQELQKNIDKNTFEELQGALKTSHSRLATLTKISQNIERINDLIHTHKDLQREILRLQEREKLLTDLYRIFSKEIMIKVLEDALPFFAEYINNLLTKMVPFTVRFQPKKTTTDKLELDISIQDSHGERTAKSLSGWQKAILRVAWILAVAQMTGTKQLFLDETINNIDQDTIGQVTDMLKDYLKFTNISLYLVTHASQLQEMNIWDETISVV